MQSGKKMNKKAKNAIGKYMKILSYVLYAYFGIVLIGLFAMTFAIDLKPHDFAEYFMANSWLIIISVLGIIFAYKMSRLRRWACIAEIILVSIELAALIILTLYLGEGVILPIIPVVLLIFLINGLKYLKK